LLFRWLFVGFIILFQPHFPPQQALASGPLDGQAFSGMIGPVENPDLADTLYFDDGHFWSGICTDCGFSPGPYAAEKTENGIRFSGTLASDDRGRFDYEGLVGDDGSVSVSITWERRRWYWTARREIAFVGKRTVSVTQATLSNMRAYSEGVDPTGNPMCARF
jgi:hypothetical protein